MLVSEPFFFFILLLIYFFMPFTYELDIGHFSAAFCLMLHSSVGLRSIGGIGVRVLVNICVTLNDFLVAHQKANKDKIHRVRFLVCFLCVDVVKPESMMIT